MFVSHINPINLPLLQTVKLKLSSFKHPDAAPLTTTSSKYSRHTYYEAKRSSTVWKDERCLHPVGFYPTLPSIFWHFPLHHSYRIIHRIGSVVKTQKQPYETIKKFCDRFKGYIRGGGGGGYKPTDWILVGKLCYKFQHTLLLRIRAQIPTPFFARPRAQQHIAGNLPALSPTRL